MVPFTPSRPGVVLLDSETRGAPINSSTTAESTARLCLIMILQTSLRAQNTSTRFTCQFDYICLLVRISGSLRVEFLQRALIAARRQQAWHAAMSFRKLTGRLFAHPRIYEALLREAATGRRSSWLTVEALPFTLRSGRDPRLLASSQKRINSSSA